MNTSLPAPGPVAPPVPQPPKPQPAPLSFNDDDRQVWTLLKPIAVNELAAIEQSWLRARYQRGWNFSAPLEEKHKVVRGSKIYIEQQFCAARASWEVENGLLTWWIANDPARL